jgi:hypothetical protein
MSALISFWTVQTFGNLPKGGGGGKPPEKEPKYGWIIAVGCILCAGVLFGGLRLLVMVTRAAQP